MRIRDYFRIGLCFCLIVGLAFGGIFGAYQAVEVRKEGMPVSYKLVSLLPQCAVSIDEIAEKCNSFEREVIFLGDGVDVFRDYINEHVKVDYDFAPAMCNKQRASAVACLGQVLYEQGRAENAADHKPEYLRLSQAERERQEKERDFRI